MSNSWLLTGDLNFPFTLMPTLARVPSPDFAASLISIFASLLMFHYSKTEDGPNAIAAPRLDSLEPNGAQEYVWSFMGSGFEGCERLRLQDGEFVRLQG